MTTREEREYMIKALTQAMDDNAVSGIAKMTCEVVSRIIDMIKISGEEVKDRCEHKKTEEGVRVIDREKVLKGLKACAITNGVECESTCPYYDADNCHTLFADAAALIESDIKKTAPVIRYKKEYYDNTVVGRLTCGFCGKDISSRDHFCRSCGMEVDWDAEDYAWRGDAESGAEPEGGR